MFHIGAGHNPWLPLNPNVHIGDLLRKYGGGGHKAVGGLELKTHKAALKATREIIAYLETK